jgi:hypothetical protein
VKDTWRDDRRLLEGNLYADIGCCEGVAKMYSYGVVQVDGKDDTTADLIRCGLQPEGAPRRIDASQKMIVGSDITTSTPDKDRRLISRYIDIDYLPVLEESDARPRSRTHSRLVMETYGWPIKFAKSLVELVGAMRDAIIGAIFTFEGTLVN